MVRALADTIGGADTIETALLLAADDVTGPASFDYFLQKLAMPFDVHVNGADHAARAFSEPRIVDFPHRALEQERDFLRDIANQGKLIQGLVVARNRDDCRIPECW